ARPALPRRRLRRPHQSHPPAGTVSSCPPTTASAATASTAGAAARSAPAPTSATWPPWQRPPSKAKASAALDALCRPRTNHGRCVARFNPLNPGDLALFRAALAGEHAIVGFRNRDLSRRLYRRPPSDRD